MDVVIGHSRSFACFPGDYALNLVPTEFSFPNPFLDLFSNVLKLVSRLFLCSVRIHIHTINFVNFLPQSSKDDRKEKSGLHPSLHRGNY